MAFRFIFLLSLSSSALYSQGFKLPRSTLAKRDLSSFTENLIFTSGNTDGFFVEIGVGGNRVPVEVDITRYVGATAFSFRMIG